MRKIIYAVILTLLSAVSFVACTEETVTPTQDNSTGGGAGSADPILPTPGKYGAYNRT